MPKSIDPYTRGLYWEWARPLNDYFTAGFLHRISMEFAGDDFGLIEIQNIGMAIIEEAKTLCIEAVKNSIMSAAIQGDTEVYVVIRDIPKDLTNTESNFIVNHVISVFREKDFNIFAMMHKVDDGSDVLRVEVSWDNG